MAYPSVAPLIAQNLAKYLLQSDPKLKPVIYSYRTTMRCNLRCEYCWQFQKDLLNRGTPPDTDHAKRVLTIIRQSSPFVLITGGDPLMRQDIVELMEFAKKELDFHRIYFITNGSRLHEFRSVLSHIDYLYVSLDSLRVEKYAERLGVSPRVVETMISNVKEVSALQEDYGFRMSVNIVVDGDSIDDSSEVVDFCVQHNIRFGFNPRRYIELGTYDRRLKDNKAYTSLIDKIIALKSDGKLVAPSYEYLRTVRDFVPFNCNPVLFTPIMPNGDLIYPCSVDGRAVGNIVELGSCEAAIERGIEMVGTIKDFKQKSRLCKNECFCVPYTVPALFLKNPLSGLDFMFRSRRSCGAD